MRSGTFTLYILTATCLAMVACTNELKSSTAGKDGSSTNQVGLPSPSPAPSPVPSPGPIAGPQPAPAPMPMPMPARPGCGMQTNTGAVAFCETFDQPSPVVGRSGQLDSLVWGVSRVLTSDAGVGVPYAIPDTQLDYCGTMQTVNSPSDVKICNGQLRQSTNDNMDGGFQAGSVSNMSMYPKQPFDFSGRTGTVAFDVSNDTAGGHAAWPEFWMSDQPVPTPFNHFGSWISVPANGFGIRLSAYARAGTYGICPNNDNTPRFTVESAVVVRDWVLEDAQFAQGNNQSASNCMDPGTPCVQTGMIVKPLDCVTQDLRGPNGGLNHIEIKISQNRIDVYATDAGTTAPLKHIAEITRANLTFTRGFIWLQDNHYNADKGAEERVSQKTHTFAWDNVAFDGPVIARERAFDVVDSKIPYRNGAILGWDVAPTAPARLTTLPIPAADLVAARTALLMFNFVARENPTTFTYSVNGHSHTVAWPFPDRKSYSGRTIALPILLTELVMGPNQITIGANADIAVSNVGISLAGAGGIVNPR